MKRVVPVATVAALVVAGAVVSLSAAALPVQAQAESYPVTLTMTGPSTAEAGQEITYRLRYELTDPATKPKTAIVISFTPGATYVLTQVISGTDGFLRPHSETYWRWSDLGNSMETMGEIEMVVRIDADFRGSVFGSAYVPGTNTTSSNIVETQVFALGTLPQAGGGGAINSGSGVALLLFALIGAALLCAGAVTRMTARD